MTNNNALWKDEYEATEIKVIWFISTINDSKKFVDQKKFAILVISLINHWKRLNIFIHSTVL